MEDKFKLLEKEFFRIKKLGLVKGLRSGSTGIGYTFETLLGKKEDNSFYPDFNGIEIKTRLGYSNSCMTLFNLTPQSSEGYSMKNLLNDYGYPDKKFHYYNSFKIDVDCRTYNNVGSQKYYFHLVIDYISKKVFLFIYDKDANIVNDLLYWPFFELEKRLTSKLQNLAVVTGYPYQRDGSVYYRYFKMDLYKLRDFNTFLSLLRNGSIYVTFNLDIFKSGFRRGQLHDHGTSFRIKKEALEELFIKIK